MAKSLAATSALATTSRWPGKASPSTRATDTQDSKTVIKMVQDALTLKVGDSAIDESYDKSSTHPCPGTK